MIEKIQIKNVATYASTTEELTNLKKINFVYGSNGTGKTTISRVIADCAAYPDCAVIWRGGAEIEKLVYNRDFIEENFNQPDELKGIFTLGQKDKETIGKIDAAKTKLGGVNAKIIQLQSTLDGDESSKGKITELEELETEFEAKCWELKHRHDEKFQGAFAGLRSNKRKFKARLLVESKTNESIAVPLTNLKKDAETVFGDTLQRVGALTAPNGDALLAHEINSILGKNVIGKVDVDIAALIQQLGSSDWVKQGRKFYNPEERVCPFCQQGTPPSLEDSLNEYFDEAFKADTAAIEKLYTDYKADSERIQQSIKMLIDNPLKFLNSENLQSESALLHSKIQINILRIEEKRRESSKPIELDSLKNVLVAVKTLIEEANSGIEKHNMLISNIDAKRTELTGQVWRYLLDHEINSDLASFTKKEEEIQKGIAGIKAQIAVKTKERQTKEQEIKTLEKDATSIQPTIDNINDILRLYGFTDFILKKSNQNRFYKIQRLDGSDAKETLSEGEKSFITFLYFYHLLEGSETESGMTSDRVVIFDDPVSSLDSDILFIVSNLIKEVFDKARQGSKTIKQVFVMTHNVYFHKEVSFNSKRSGDGLLKDETFWTVRKSNHESKIRSHKTNPITTSYELLWSEVRNPDKGNLAIQNALRRILEYYYKILGNFDPDAICNYFDGSEKLLCRSLFSWVNDGSHSSHDSLYISIDDSMVERNLNVLKLIFEKTGHIAHYNMMMKKHPAEAEAESPESVTP